MHGIFSSKFPGCWPFFLIHGTCHYCARVGSFIPNTSKNVNKAFLMMMGFPYVTWQISTLRMMVLRNVLTKGRVSHPQRQSRWDQSQQPGWTWQWAEATPTCVRFVRLLCLPRNLHDKRFQLRPCIQRFLQKQKRKKGEIKNGIENGSSLFIPSPRVSLVAEKSINGPFISQLNFHLPGYTFFDTYTRSHFKISSSVTGGPKVKISQSIRIDTHLRNLGCLRCWLPWQAAQVGS